MTDLHLAEYWVSGNNFRSEPTFTWEFGTSLEIPTKDKDGVKLEVHAWAEGQDDEEGDCVAICPSGRRTRGSN